MYTASSKGDTQSVRALAQLGANIDTSDSATVSPLLIASQNGHTETVRALVQLGANIHTPNKNGGTPVYFAALSIAIEKIKQKKNLPRLTWRQNVISRERPKLKCSQSEVTL